MPLIYIPFSQKDNLLGLHIYLRTRYSQSKVKVSHLNTILQFTTFIEWIEKENVEEADYANFSTKNILIRKTGRVRCGDGVPKYWNNSRKHLQYKPFCFLFSVFRIIMLQSHIFTGEEMIWKNFESCIPLYISIRPQRWCCGLEGSSRKRKIGCCSNPSRNRPQS